jgi:hypothetical protein
MSNKDEQTSLIPVQSNPHRSFTQQSIRAIEQISQNAHRLLQEVNDTDSVNGLLEDDYSVGSGIEDFFDEEEDVRGGYRRGSVTQSDLEYLSGKPSSCDEDDAAIGDSRKDKLVDRMGEQLLNATNTESEARILRQSLKLDPRSLPSSSFNLEDFDSRPTRHVSDRVHESTRALRSTMLTTSQRGSRAALLEMMAEEEEDYKEKKYLLAPTPLQIGRMLSLSLVLMMVLYLLLSWGTKAVGPPRLPIGEYKIIEAQVGHQFFQYYEFYAGKDSAGSNGYNLYVSRETAERDGIVNVITEVVDESSMVEIYEDDRAMEEDWLLEDLEFLDELKRKKVDEAQEAEESAKVAAIKKTNTNGTDSSNTTSSTDKTKTSGNGKKQTKNTTKRKNNRRHLQNTPSRLEAFNPDPNNNTDATPTETFVILSSSPTEEGPRNSIRLEGRRRFNRGLFIIDLRHMPAGTLLVFLGCQSACDSLYCTYFNLIRCYLQLFL